MSYAKALEAAGAEVIVMEEFGSYQGEWWAKVRFNGEVGWVNGSYGSCSGCDAFEGEFGFRDSHAHDGDNYYDPIWQGFVEGCAECAQVKQRLSNFGLEYLDCLHSQDRAIELASRYLDWDFDAQEMVKFIQDNAID